MTNGKGFGWYIYPNLKSRNFMFKIISQITFSEPTIYCLVKIFKESNDMSNWKDYGLKDRQPNNVPGNVVPSKSLNKQENYFWVYQKAMLK